MNKEITGEDVGALLHWIHAHYPEKEKGHKLHIDTASGGKIIFFEEDLIPVLEALGLPKPVWKHSMSIATWKRLKKRENGKR